MARAMRPAFALWPALGLAACTPAPEQGAPGEAEALIGQDPVIARALQDPLMSDPDLASRNQANAAIGFPDSHALPVLAAGSAEAQAAREALRIALLEGGAIPDLPPAQGVPPPPLGPMTGAGELLAAVDAPADCAGQLREDFALAAGLPAAAVLPPRAMVMQAGAGEGAVCGLRIIRYLSAAPREDVLQYHYTRARRAGLAAAHHPDRIAARGEGSERLIVHVRSGPQGLTGVTLVYRPS